MHRRRRRQRHREERALFINSTCVWARTLTSLATWITAVALWKNRYLLLQLDATQSSFPVFGLGLLRMINAKNRKTSSYLFSYLFVCYFAFIIVSRGGLLSRREHFFVCLFLLYITAKKLFLITLKTELPEIRRLLICSWWCGVAGESGTVAGNGAGCQPFSSLIFTIAKIKKPFAAASRFLILGFVYLTRVFMLLYSYFRFYTACLKVKIFFVIFFFHILFLQYIYLFFCCFASLFYHSLFCIRL